MMAGPETWEEYELREADMLSLKAKLISKLGGGVWPGWKLRIRRGRQLAEMSYRDAGVSRAAA